MKMPKAHEKSITLKVVRYAIGITVSDGDFISRTLIKLQNWRVLKVQFCEQGGDAK